MMSASFYTDIMIQEITAQAGVILLSNISQTRIFSTVYSITTEIC